jgi:hypothetical protein
MLSMENKLAERRIQAENSFNALSKQKEQKEAELKDIDTELLRLQGEWRLIDDLLKKQKPTEAEVIDVDKALKKKGSAK